MTRRRPRGRAPAASSGVVQRLQPRDRRPRHPRRRRDHRARLRPGPAHAALAGARHDGAGRHRHRRHRRARPVGDDALPRRGRRVASPCPSPCPPSATRCRIASTPRGPDAPALRRGRRDRRGERRAPSSATCSRAHGRIDVLVNGVGGFAGGDLASTSLADWDRIMTLNLTSAVIGCRAVLPAMTAARRGPHRQHRLARGGAARSAASSPTRWPRPRVITLTQALAREVGRRASRSTRCCRAPWTRRATAGPCPTPTAPSGSARTPSPRSSPTSPPSGRAPSRARASPCDEPRYVDIPRSAEDRPMRRASIALVGAALLAAGCASATAPAAAPAMPPPAAARPAAPPPSASPRASSRSRSARCSPTASG